MQKFLMQQVEREHTTLFAQHETSQTSVSWLPTFPDTPFLVHD